MLEFKSIKIRESLLLLLESGALTAGTRLPGLRRISEQLGGSYPHVQTVVESLVQAGIFKTLSRSGTYVQKDWQTRLLQGTFASYWQDTWHDHLKDLIHQQIPDLHICRQFTRGIFELRVTHYLFSHHDEYMDLQPLFDQCFPDKQDFFEKILPAFKVNGKLCGIPWNYSPRILFFNKNIFKQADCPFPQDNWSWDDFLETVARLKKILPPHQIFNWYAMLHIWINIVIRCGGELFTTTSPDPVRLDSPETIRGLELFADLRQRLFGPGEPSPNPAPNYMNDFAEGKAAMFLGSRQIFSIFSNMRVLSRADLGGVNLPMPEGGRDATMLAADLLCIRNECSDFALARMFLTQMLSDSTQQHIGQLGYGIPFRYSAAIQSLKTDDPLDVRFLTEVPKMEYAYNVFSPELYAIVTDGLAELCLMRPEMIADKAHQLADAVRLLLDILNRHRNHVQ